MCEGLIHVCMSKTAHAAVREKVWKGSDTLLGCDPGDKANSDTFWRWSLLAIVSTQQNTI